MSSNAASAASKNHIHNPIRNADAFQTALAISTSSRRPLLTLWTTSYCPTCKTVSPLLRSLVSSGVGEAEGGVSFAEVEFDSPDIMGGPDSLPMTYMITSVPTLLSFDGGEAMTQTKVVDGRRLADRQFLQEWIRSEARRRGDRGGGGGGGSSSPRIPNHRSRPCCAMQSSSTSHCWQVIDTLSIDSRATEHTEGEVA
ncbi:hypothetical protein NLU13_0436 [Sarocladium strictum]|uniref:Thioredoxin domain-containing protein n=1 Tax=Sarocladium strictum TaxID=5046 RepID=A0AA39LB99_SARSR|nr:hypothetical protein NLU13_0436 [Sarocladium strictum]